MPGERLDGWKEISDYLKRDVRTCQRWEKEFGLPVHRINRFSFRSKVFAFRSELNHWLETRYKGREEAFPILTRKTHIPVYVFVLIVVFIISLSVFFTLFFHQKEENLIPSAYDASKWKLKGRSLNFYDYKDRYLWRVEIDNPLNLDDYYHDVSRDEDGNPHLWLERPRVDFADIDGDGKNEVICFVYHENPDERVLILFDNTGDKMWSRAVHFDQNYEGGKIVYDYLIQQVRFEDINQDGKKEILALWKHQKRFPGIFEIYDTSGHRLFNYWHTGTLKKFFFYPGKSNEIYLGGTNNLLDGEAVLIVLDCRNLKSGLGPPYALPAELAGKKDELWKYIPRNYTPACQKTYIRFKKNELAPIFGIRWQSVVEVRAGKSGIFAGIIYGKDIKRKLYYSFDENLSLRYVMESAEFRRDFAGLIKEGSIEIALPEFLQECGSDVLFWTEEGWSKKLPQETSKKMLNK